MRCDVANISDASIAKAAVEALDLVTYLVEHKGFDLPVPAREAMARLAGAVARADRSKPEPDDGQEVAIG